MEHTVTGQTFDEERALYNLRDTEVKGCLFAGPADGESALKECCDIRVTDCDFRLRYPLWHAHDFEVADSSMTDDCRAALWYCSDGRITGSKLHGVKCLRECDRVTVSGCDIDSVEFGWKCRDVSFEDTVMKSEYPFLDSSGIRIAGLTMDAKYSFQYVSDVRIENSVLRTKDAFWHSRDVTVVDSEVHGEYLGWYSDNLTLINCRIIGTQPLCYCRNLRLVDCTMENTDLSFEYSDVQAEVRGHIDSVKNPRSGRIHAGSIGELVLGNQVMECDCQVVTDDRMFS